MNGHSISNKSNSKLELSNKEKDKERESIDKLEKVESKYQQKLGELKAALEEKDRLINAIRKKHD